MIAIMSTVFPYDNIANSSISDKCLKCLSLNFSSPESKFPKISVYPCEKKSQVSCVAGTGLVCKSQSYVRFDRVYLYQVVSD